MDKPEPLVSQLFAVIKRKLKAKSITYRDIAYTLDATEISVKRWFAEERLTIRQVTTVANMIGISLGELIQEAEEPPLQQTTQEQEQAVMDDLRLALVLQCVVSNLSVKEIIASYVMSEAECVQHLVKLDQLRLIDLLPDNQVRLRISRDFEYLPNGPINQFANKTVIPKLMASDFHGPYANQFVLRANLTPNAIKQFKIYLRHLRRQLAELHTESFAEPLEQRQRFYVAIAYRNWELLDEFAAMRRTPPHDMYDTDKNKN